MAKKVQDYDEYALKRYARELKARNTHSARYGRDKKALQAEINRRQRVADEQYHYNQRQNMEKAGQIKESGNGVFLILVLTVIVLTVFALLHNGDSFTFQGFLEFLGNLESLPVQKLLVEGTVQHITADWTFFNFFRDFLNFFTDLFNIVIFFAACVGNIIHYVFQLLRWLFL